MDNVGNIETLEKAELVELFSKFLEDVSNQKTAKDIALVAAYYKPRLEKLKRGWNESV